MTDFKFHSLGAPQLGPGKEPLEGEQYGEDRGLAFITSKEEDLYKFKTPTLRNVSITGPWLHAGTYNSLFETIVQHSEGEGMMAEYLQFPFPYINSDLTEEFTRWIDPSRSRARGRVKSRSEKLNGMNLDTKEVALLVEFLESLSDDSFKDRFEVPQSVPSGLPVED